MPCRAVGAFDNSNNQTAFAINNSGPASAGTVPVTVVIGIKKAGALQTGTYSSSTSPEYGGSVTSNPGSATISMWASASNLQQGSLSVSITSATTLAAGDSGTGYSIHGTADGTFPAVKGTSAAGTVTVHAAF